jgi:hypothetical protein
MDDFILPTIELLFQYVDSAPQPATEGERVSNEQRRAHAADVGRARTRWLAEHHAEASFPCGVVRGGGLDG